jgi:hypothetical protein
VGGGVSPEEAGGPVSDMMVTLTPICSTTETNVACVVSNRKFG